MILAWNLVFYIMSVLFLNHTALILTYIVVDVNDGYRRRQDNRGNT